MFAIDSQSRCPVYEPVSYTHLDVYKRQRFLFADASTFLGYNSNLRSLVVDKLANCDIVIFNRFTGDMDPMDFHKIVRGISRRANIAYEYENLSLIHI